MNTSTRTPDARPEDTLSSAALLATGLLAGMSAPFMRAASRHGVEPLVWTLLTSTVAGGLLVSASLVRGARIHVSGRHVAFYAAAGLFSIALPNVLLFAATRTLGAATASLAYALPPMMTVALAFLTGIERATAKRAAGVAVGLAGALAAILPGRSVSAHVPWTGGLVLFLVPLSIAIGNLIRARFWPRGSNALGNAAGTTSAGVLWLAGALLAAPAPAHGAETFILLLAIPQGAASAGAMVLFFWLQRRAGAVFTSQVGYFATLTGITFATVAFGEHLSPWAWAAAALIALGTTIGRERV